MSREKQVTPGKPLRSLSSDATAPEQRRHYLQNLIHELSTPLTPLMGYLKLFERQSLGDLNELQERCLGRMARSAHRLQRILEDFGDLLQMESGMYEPEPEPVEFGALIEDALSAMAGKATEQKIDVLVQGEEEPVWVTGDATKLRRAIEHLLSNAIKFNSAGGKLLVCWARADDPSWLRVEIFDTGVGIPTADLDEAFSPFFQSDHSATRRFEGAGIGLSLVRWVAEKHGGRVAIESPPSEQPEGHFFRGVRAILELPVRAETAT